jgi:hypothetical protein
MKIALSPFEMIAGARNSDGVPIPGMEPARFVWTHINNARRLEIRDYPALRREWLKATG